MKWINGETQDSKVKRITDWHVWFAWYPVIVGEIETPYDGKRRSIKIWWEYVMRKQLYSYDDIVYEYKEIEEFKK